MIHFFDQRPRVDNHTVADDAQGPPIEDAGRDEVENKGAPVVDDGMSGVRPALIADHRIGVTRQHIDNFALAFIAPLGAYDNEIRHAASKKMAPGTQWAGAGASW